MVLNSSIAIKETASSLIAAYELNTLRMKEGFDLLVQAEEGIDRTFNSYRVGKFHSSYVRDKEKALMEFRVKAWRSIVNNLGLPKVMSLKRQKEFDENCSSDKLPEINTKNVFTFLDDVLGSANEIAMETVLEVYNFLRPGARQYNRHKTNEKNARWKLGEKIIITSALEYGYGHTPSFRVNYWHEPKIIQVDRVMFLLDGAGIPDGYKSPLVDAINTTPYLSGKTGETDYFLFRCFYNGNIHLTFKRLDLVERLNAAAGGGNVLGDG
jgi:hypothetical protein